MKRSRGTRASWQDLRAVLGRACFPWVALTGLATLALAGAFVFAPGQLGLALKAYLVFLAGAAALGGAAVVSEALVATRRSPYESAMRPGAGEAATGPEELERLALQVEFSTSSALDFHHRLRPLLREVARERLAELRGIDFDSEPEQARLALGELLWSTVSEAQEPPDRLAAGPSLVALSALIEGLERL